jgi:alkylation response protein AidB-like acyl-CoA dehydrogenase
MEAVEAVGREADALAGETEALRRLPDDLAAGLVRSGLLRAWVPTTLGGGGADVATVLDAIEALAWHDGATAWCGMIGATTSLTAGRLDPRWAAEIYGDPLAVTGGYAMPAGRARAVDGGLVVSGEWQWGSFTHHCTWIGGGCLLVGEDGTPSPREDGLLAPFVFFDPSQVELLDTWRVTGLKGTGSTDYRVVEVFVPEGRWAQVVGPALLDGPLHRFPLLGALSLGVCAVALGLARRAQDELVALAGGKRPAQSGRLLAERPVVQAQVAQAEAGRRAARALVREVVAEAWDAASEGDELTVEHRRLLRLAATDATRRAAASVDLMYEAGGGSSIHETSPLQRVFRDVHVATQHGMVASRTYEVLGRIALGLPTDTSTL